MQLKTKAKYTDEVTPLEISNQKLAYQAACEAIVLLENRGVLPLTVGKVALYGAGARRTIKGGSGSGEVIERHAVSISEGLKNRGFEIVTDEWLDRYDALWIREKEAFITKMRKKLKSISTKTLAEMMAADFRYPYGDAIRQSDLSDQTDTCIYVLSRQSGEGTDRRQEDYCLSDTERAHLCACASYYRHIILIVNTGSSFDLSFVKNFPAIEAVVFACQLGQEGGNALADILSGRVNPSGRLAVTWAQHYEDFPFAQEYSCLGKDLSRAVYSEGIYVGYRYFDSFDVSPAYPFGYGLSYTDYQISDISVTAKSTGITVVCTVTNTGERAGKETVQLYVSAPSGIIDHEYQSLAAFAKTDLLQPGGKEELTLQFDLKNIASYDESSASMILEAGDYILRIGSSSRSTRPCAAMHIKEMLVVSRHRNLCSAKNAVAKLFRTAAPEENSVIRIDIDPAGFRTKDMDYSETAAREDVRVSDLLKKMSIRDQIRFCAGTGLFGKPEFTVPGAVGNTTSDFWKAGIPNAVFCDGPAGLRLQRRSTADGRGNVKPVDGAMSIYEYLPPVIQKLLFGNPGKEKMLYQYVTAFPVAAAVAQTWNVELAEMIGAAVSAEMTEYGAVFWLAPAMNIVRNPLCGRNYEYYSEDPLISGKMAAAVVRGVQSVSGNYATIKHFAANNQEENRYYVSSEVDERVLREIYLRGFEIAVKEAAPKALMSAYNRINGVYCSENTELIDFILRREWGFEGIVMSDWFSTGEDRARNAECIAAGMDLIMPGGGTVRKELLNAYKEGRLSDKDIYRAAANVLHLVINSQIRAE